MYLVLNVTCETRNHNIWQCLDVQRFRDVLAQQNTGMQTTAFWKPTPRFSGFLILKQFFFGGGDRKDRKIDAPSSSESR